MDDPEIRPLLEAAGKFDRVSLGFSALPETADVRFESQPREHYDVMLHIYADTSRTIAFRRSDSGYRWTGEQETFTGPKKYTTVDGTFNESICFTYDTEQISGYPLNQLCISYSGEDPRLTQKDTLTLSDVQPILKEWKKEK